MKPSPNVRAVIFDLDGTLVDSMPVVIRGFAHALAPYRPDLGEAGIFQRLGGPPERTFRELIGDEAQAAEALLRWKAFDEENDHLAQPFTGSKELLQRLSARHLKLAIWTGRDRQTTEAILKTHALSGFFSAIVCGDDLPNNKPHPAGLIAILARLDVRPEEALYSGDADSDVLGGASAQVRTVLIRHGRNVDASIINQAWCVVDTPPHAYALIEAEIATRSQ